MMRTDEKSAKGKSMDDDPKTRTAHDESKIATDWKLLDFGFQPTRSVQQVRVTVSEEGVKLMTQVFGTAALGTTPFTAASTESETLSHWQRYLDVKKCLARVNLPNTGGASGGGAYRFGKIEIETSDGAFLIGITMDGFALDSEFAENHNVFWNPFIAELLNVTSIRRCGKPIPVELLAILSGEDQIRSGRRMVIERFLRPNETPGR